MGSGSDDRRIVRIDGRAIPLRGDNIDTDRIIPARFLKSVRFEGLEDHLFEDDRRALETHPFSNPAYRGASVLLVNRNFGCGSSREHAPQAIRRWGIQAVVGESFSEIFFGNAVALGMPCLTLPHDGVEVLLAAAEADPRQSLSVSLIEMTVSCGDRRLEAALPAAARDALLTGTWDATGLLLDRYEDVLAVAARLPYLRGFET